MSLEMVRGNNRTIRTTIYTTSAKTTPMDLAGVHDIVVTGRLASAAGVVVFQKKLSLAQITVESEANGIILTPLEPADTHHLPNARTLVVYEVEVKTADDEVISTENLEQLLVQPNLNY